MILNILALLILIACIIPIFLIVTKHFGVLASIDVEALPSERDANVKNRLIQERLKRKFGNFLSIVALFAEPTRILLERLRKPFEHFYTWLLDIREAHRKQIVVGGATVTFDNASVDDKIAILLERAVKYRSEEHLEDAENAYVDIIALNKKQVEAYEGLAGIYTEKREWEKAEAVLGCVCKILKERGTAECTESFENEQLHYAETLLDLAAVYKRTDHYPRAWECIKEAVELQNNNPKFLDALVDVHVLLGQRLKAEKALDLLAQANPDNQKIEEFKGRICELSY